MGSARAGKWPHRPSNTKHSRGHLSARNQGRCDFYGTLRKYAPLAISAGYLSIPDAIDRVGKHLGGWKEYDKCISTWAARDAPGELAAARARFERARDDLRMLISAGTVKAILKDNRCGQRYALRADGDHAAELSVLFFTGDDPVSMLDHNCKGGPQVRE